jgi:hypothetical protein
VDRKSLFTIISIIEFIIIFIIVRDAVVCAHGCCRWWLLLVVAAVPVDGGPLLWIQRNRLSFFRSVKKSEEVVNGPVVRPWSGLQYLLIDFSVKENTRLSAQ